MGVVPHNISLEHHSGSGRKSEGKNASKSDKGGPGGDPHKAFDRKEKNRQAAQRSRKRKQDHMADLEATVARQALEIESLRCLPSCLLPHSSSPAECQLVVQD